MGQRGIRRILVILLALGDSPGWDEAGHFAAGLSHLHSGAFSLHGVDPPLPRVWAALLVTVVVHDAGLPHHAEACQFAEKEPSHDAARPGP
jgi:hypothetical protein